MAIMSDTVEVARIVKDASGALRAGDGFSDLVTTLGAGDLSKGLANMRFFAMRLAAAGARRFSVMVDVIAIEKSGTGVVHTVRTGVFAVDEPRRVDGAGVNLVKARDALLDQVKFVTGCRKLFELGFFAKGHGGWAAAAVSADRRRAGA